MKKDIKTRQLSDKEIEDLRNRSFVPHEPLNKDKPVKQKMIHSEMFWSILLTIVLSGLAVLGVGSFFFSSYCQRWF